MIRCNRPGQPSNRGTLQLLVKRSQRSVRCLDRQCCAVSLSGLQTIRHPTNAVPGTRRNSLNDPLSYGQKVGVASPPKMPCHAWKTRVSDEGQQQVGARTSNHKKNSSKIKVTQGQRAADTSRARARHKMLQGQPLEEQPAPHRHPTSRPTSGVFDKKTAAPKRLFIRQRPKRLKPQIMVAPVPFLSRQELLLYSADGGTKPDFQGRR